MKHMFSVLFFMAVAFSGPTSAANPEINLPKKQVKVLTATAKTADDHLKLAQYYDQRAEALFAKSRQHEAMAEAARKNQMAGSKLYPMTSLHCEGVAKSYRQKAERMKQTAAEHRGMAEKAGI